MRPAARRESQRGQVLAEFAIGSLVALMIIFGIIDYARAMYMYQLVTDDARLATRYAIVNGVAACAGGSPDPLQAFVNGRAPSMGTLTVTTTCPGGNTGCSSSASPYDGSGCLVTVNVATSFHFIVPLVSKLVIPMSSTSQMVISP